MINIPPGREEWGKELPFLFFVQLAPYKYGTP